jgi:hypothetical protein
MNQDKKTEQEAEERVSAEDIYMSEQRKYRMSFGCYTLPEGWETDAMIRFSTKQTATLTATIEAQREEIERYRDTLRQIQDCTGTSTLQWKLATDALNATKK